MKLNNPRIEASTGHESESKESDPFTASGASRSVVNTNGEVAQVSDWPTVLCNGMSVFALSCAAAYASTRSTHKGVGIAAWVAVAIIGTTSSIAITRKNRRQRHDDPRRATE